MLAEILKMISKYHLTTGIFPNSVIMSKERKEILMQETGPYFNNSIYVGNNVLQVLVSDSVDVIIGNNLDSKALNVEIKDLIEVTFGISNHHTLDDLIIEGVVEYALFHRKYNFPNTFNLNKNDFLNFEEMKIYLESNYNIPIIKPVYLYDHSGLAVSTGEFGCRFDSSQIGYAFVRMEKIDSLFGKENERITSNIDKALDLFKEEFTIFQEYINGNVCEYHYTANEGYRQEFFVGTLEECENHLRAIFVSDDKTDYIFKLEKDYA